MPEIIVKLGDKILHRYFFDKEILSIGRARDNDIVIENLAVSRNHARIRRQDDTYILTDLNSANGTYVNGARVTKTDVVDGDLITVGKHTLAFVLEPEEASAPSAPEEVIEKHEEEEEFHPEGPIPVLTVTKGKQAGQQFKLLKKEISIGRANDNDIRLHDWFVSKKHAMVIRKNNIHILRDLQSWRGTTVNGNTISEIELADGDEILLGTTVLKYRAAVAPEEIEEQPQAASLPEEHEMVSQEDISVEAVEEMAPQEEQAPPEVSPEPEPEEEPHHAAEEEAQEAVQFEEEITLGDQEPSEEEALAQPRDTQPPSDSQLDLEDEYAPMTDEELAALEAEAELEFSREDDEVHRREAWELTEAEYMFNRDFEDEEHPPSLIEDNKELQKAEEAAVGEFSPEDLEEKLEGSGLEGGEEEDGRMLGVGSDTGEINQALGPVDSGISTLNYSREEQIAIWERALNNKSPLIQQTARKELKKLTGKDNDE